MTKEERVNRKYELGQKAIELDAEITNYGKLLYNVELSAGFKAAAMEVTHSNNVQDKALIVKLQKEAKRLEKLIKEKENELKEVMIEFNKIR